MSATDNQKVTRGSGFLEAFLAKKRSQTANRLMSSSLREGRLLDVGCGSFPFFLANTSFKEKYGIDGSEAITRYHQLPGSDASLKVQYWNFGEKKVLPFDGNFFDVVTMLAVFEHIEKENLHALVSEIHRILKPQGEYIITVPAGWTDGLLRFMAKIRLVSGVEIEDHKDTYSRSKIASILQGGGFNQNTIQSGYFEFFMNIWTKAVK